MDTTIQDLLPETAIQRQLSNLPRLQSPAPHPAPDPHVWHTPTHGALGAFPLNSQVPFHVVIPLMLMGSVSVGLRTRVQVPWVLRHRPLDLDRCDTFGRKGQRIPASASSPAGSWPTSHSPSLPQIDRA